MKIIRDIINGERAPLLLAKHRNYRCKNSLEIIQKSLTGHYRAEHVFALTQALELFDSYQDKIIACDKIIEKTLSTFEHKNETAQVTLKKNIS